MSRSPLPPANAPAYHHGDLHNALIEAGRELARESGADALSLRQVTRRAGVSHAAAYHHFTDRTDLLRGIALRAFGEFTADLQASIDPASADHTAHSPWPDPTIESLENMAVAYLSFAMKHSAEFRFMFSSELCMPPGEPDPVEEAAYASQDVLRGLIIGLQRVGVIAVRDAEPVVMAVWSQIHGFTMIVIDTRVFAGAPVDVVEQLCRDGVRQLVIGLSASGPSDHKA